MRIALSRLAIRTGRFIGELPIAIMRPADRADFSRQAYDRASGNYAEINDQLEGLAPDEKRSLEKTAVTEGRVLILGAGGGREVLFFAARGFSVVGLDFSEGMLSQAGKLAKRHGVEFEARIGDLVGFEAGRLPFDLIWFSMFLYSAVLGRKSRVATLRRLGANLAPGGAIVCSFAWNPRLQESPNKMRLLKALGWLTFGNRQIERGDAMLGTIEFRHVFSRAEDLEAEFAAAGLEVLDLIFLDDFGRGSAILRKRESGPA
jgi:SAM-dependent methyltransferase